MTDEETRYLATTVGLRELSDAELIASARKGDSDAYGELYRRHIDSARAAARALTRSHSDADDLTSEAFARVLRALQGGGGPEVSFRPYLVTAVRNVFYDKVRRNREEPSADLGDEVNVALLDAANSQQDGAFASAAFATLPERWQLVLWHTEVEGRSVTEVAPLLGLAPNAVAALAYRAREGLRQAYLQAHLRDQQVAECRVCAASLGAYVRDGLSARDRRRIDDHLEGCVSCTALVAELTDTNNTLRSALIPALIGVSPAAYLSRLGAHGRWVRLTRLPQQHQLLAGGLAAGGLVAAGVIAIAVFASVFGGGKGSAELSAPTSSARQVVLTTDSVSNDSESNDSVFNDSVPSSDSVPPTVTTTATIPVVPSATLPRPRISPPTTSIRPAINPPTTIYVTTSTTQPPVSSLLAVTSQQRSPALSGGQFRLLMNVTNTSAYTANGGQLNIDVPAGATLLQAAAIAAADAPSTYGFGSFAPAASCTGNVVCSLPVLQPGQSAMVQLSFAVSPSAPAGLTFTPSISGPGGSTVTSPPVTVPVETVADVLVAETERGEVRAIGNTVLTCNGPDFACKDSPPGGPLPFTQLMDYVNTAGGTLDSSSAQLQLTGSPSRAYLVWAGRLDQSTPASTVGFDKVNFSTPAGTTSVIADRTKNFDAEMPGNLGMYAAYADVTSLVGGSGTYSVAEVKTGQGPGSFGGWSLIVVDHDASLPERFMMVTAPFSLVTGTTASTSLSFGVGLPQTMVDAHGAIVVAGFAGDPTLQLDQVSLSGVTINNPFRCKIGGVRNPALVNSWGTDVLLAATTGMNGNRLAFDARSGDDRAILPLVGISLDL